MKGLIARGELLARKARRRAIERTVARLREQFPGAKVVEEAEAVAIRGRGLVRRFLIDPSLRFLNVGRS